MRFALHFVLFVLFSFFYLGGALASKTTPSSSPGKVYDPALQQPSVNDVRAFVYQWYGLMDHQASAGAFKKNIVEKPLFVYVDGTVKSFDDFKKRYKMFRDTIQSSTHRLDDSISISGNAQQGYKVIFVVHHTAKTYDKKDIRASYKVTWLLSVDDKHKLLLKNIQEVPLKDVKDMKDNATGMPLAPIPSPTPPTKK